MPWRLFMPQPCFSRPTEAHQHLPLCSATLILLGNCGLPLQPASAACQPSSKWILSTPEASALMTAASLMSLRLLDSLTRVLMISHFNTCIIFALKSVPSLRGPMSVRLTLCSHCFPQYQKYTMKSIRTTFLPAGYDFLETVEQYNSLFLYLGCN